MLVELKRGFLFSLLISLFLTMFICNIYIYIYIFSSLSFLLSMCSIKMLELRGLVLDRVKMKGGGGVVDCIKLEVG